MSIINSSKKRGIASLDSFRGRLRIQLPRQLFGGKQKYLSLDLADTPTNRMIAQAKLEKIQRDIDWDDFDSTLERYRSQAKKESHLKIVPDPVSQMNLKQLWEAYLNYLKPTRKESTFFYFQQGITPKIEKCPFQSPNQAVEIRNWLLEQTTESMTKRVLIQLNAACKWGLKYKKIEGLASPFEGMAQEFKHRYEKEAKPNAFNPQEKERIIKAFKSHKINGINYQHYSSFVEFLFLTGCRPNEAIGLEWSDIDPDFKCINFNGGVYCANGRFLSSKGKGSKNNLSRKFPCNEDLREFLKSLDQTHKLLFPSPKGNLINYSNFGRRAWKIIVDEIKPGTTPYSCRDTFITEQIAKGVNTAIIAKWVDNSVSMIEKHYLDSSSIGYILPR